MNDSGVDTIANIDKRRVAEQIGVSPQTFYEWWNADGDDPETYLTGYRSETEWRFRLFLAQMLGQDPEEVKVVDRVVLDPKRQERATMAALVAA
jgi:hypothetical protein